MNRPHALAPSTAVPARTSARHPARSTVLLALVALLCTFLVGLSPSPASAEPVAPTAPLTNMDHLWFLSDEVQPPPQEGHTTFELEEEPTIGMLWTYADRRDGGVYERVGGGAWDAATNTWGQGAFNADDIARVAIAFLRHHEVTGDTDSLAWARQLLRGLTFMQTATGPHAGNVVLWMQPDGTLNPSAEPVELPDPSDSGDSYWLARTIWALGEGYAAFVDTDPAFAAFLADRMQLSVDAVRRERLDDLDGVTQTVDGLQWPAWLIADGADASAEAVLGLAAYVEAGGPGDAAEVLDSLADGIAMMQLGTTHQWPYQALMPWAQSRTIWHAWGNQMAGALATASGPLGDPSLLAVAQDEAGSFIPHVWAQGGPENGWLPVPADTVQIAYGADSSLQNLLAVADATGLASFEQLAGIAGAWYFGNNPAGMPMYDPATGRTYDGISPEGTINYNSGAESTIHGVLSMLALDQRPSVAAWASVAERGDHVTWQVVEAESADWTGDAEVVTPASAWTGEGLWSGGEYLAVDGRADVSIPVDLPTRDRQWVQPVFQRREQRGQRFQVGIDAATGRPIDSGGAGDQGVTAVPGYLAVDGRLTAMVGPGSHDVAVQTLRPRDDLQLDAVIVQPALEWLVLGTGGDGQAIVRSFDLKARTAAITVPGVAGLVATAYDAMGVATGSFSASGDTVTVTVQPGGFVVARST